MNVFKAVLQSELRNLFRNRRALMGTFLPIVIIPLVMLIAGNQLTGMTKTDGDLINIGIVNSSSNSDDTIISFLEDKILSDKCISEILPFEAASSKMEEESIHVIIDISDSMNEKQLGEKYEIKIVYNSSSITSSTSAGVIHNRIDAYNNELKELFLQQYGEDYEKLNTIPFDMISLANYSDKVQGNLNPALGLVMPMLILMFVINGGSAMAVDLIAGEKERGSLEALLSTKANRTSIFLAKLITAVLMSLTTSILMTIGYTLAMIYSTGSGYNYPILNYLYLLLTAIFTSFMATAVNFLISVISQSAREAQSKVTIFSVIPTVIGASMMFTQSGNIPLFFYGIPFLNSFCLLSNAYNKTSLDFIELLIAFVSAIMIVGIVTVLSVRALNKEQVLIGRFKKVNYKTL